MTRRNDRAVERKRQAADRCDANDKVSRRPKREKSFAEHWLIGALVGAAIDLAQAVARRVRQRRAAP